MFCSQCGKELSESAKFCSSCGNKFNAVKQHVKQVDKEERIVEITSSDYVQESNEGVAHVVSKRNKTKAILWFTLPTVFLFVILSVYAITSFVMQQTADYSSYSVESTAGKLIKVALGFLGTIDVIMIIVGVIVGIILLNKKDRTLTDYDKRSGRGTYSVLPEELEGWNWGAAGLSWIWGISNSVWISLLAFVPFLNLIFWIILGIKGNEWAWGNSKWKSVSEFKRVQNKWKPWGIAVFCIQILFILISVFSE